MTENRRQTNSVYIKTVIALTLCTVLVFTVFCFLYYQQMSKSIISDESDLLYSQAQSIAAGFEKLNEDANTSSVTQEEALFLDTCAVSGVGQIWIVEEDGRISYYSEIPSSALAQLTLVGSTFYTTETQMRGLTDSSTGGSVTGTKNGLFSDPDYTWISAAYPIKNGQQYIIVHKSIDIEEQTISILTNSMAVPISISFAIALLLFTMMTRSLIRPIRMLSIAAQKVTKGDLSARVSIPEIENDETSRYFITEDLSELISTVNHMIERLEAQEKDRRRIISSIAHDLRTPLTSINGFITAILDGTIPPESYDRYLHIVKTEVDRIQTITSTISDATSLGQKSSLNPIEFDINQVIGDTLTGLEKSMDDKHLTILLERCTKYEDPLYVVGDRPAIMRVLYNLISNAIKFTPDGGTILLTTVCDQKNSQVIITIEDSGEGVPADKALRVFDSFYKLDESRANQGSGLGLYICKEILRAHDQHISVEKSEALGGAKFVFTLACPARTD